MSEIGTYENKPLSLLVVETLDIPESWIVVTVETRQKFIEGLQTWCNFKLYHLATDGELVVKNFNYGVEVFLKRVDPAIPLITVAVFSNEQIAYMVTNGSFATGNIKDKFFWYDGDMPKTNHPLGALGEEPVDDPLTENPFPPELLEVLRHVQIPLNSGLAPDPYSSVDRGTALRLLHAYIRGIHGYYCGANKIYRYVFRELRQVSDPSLQLASDIPGMIPCSREEATHVVVGVERPGHICTYTLAIADIMESSRYFQINSTDFTEHFWLSKPFNMAQESPRSSEGLGTQYVRALEANRHQEKLDAEVNGYVANMGQLMHGMLIRANELKLPQRNDGFIPLRAVEGLLSDFERWLDYHFGELINSHCGEWDRTITISNATTITLRVYDRITFKSYVLTYSYDEFFKEHIKAGLDWQPEAPTFWCLPS